MNQQKKKLTFAAVALTLVVLLLIGGTVAWLSDVRDISNIFGIGSDRDGDDLVSIKFDEPAYVDEIFAKYYGSGGIGAGTKNDPNTAGGDGHTVSTTADTVTVVEKDNKGEAIWKEITKDGVKSWELITTKQYKLLPGSSMKKDPTLKVTGEEPVYLRMRAYLRDENKGLANKDAFTAEYIGDGQGTNNMGLKPATGWSSVTSTTASGWYYFDVSGGTQKPVANTHAEIPAFAAKANGTTLTIPGEWKASDIQDVLTKYGGILDIVVEVQAVQSSNFTPNTSHATDPWNGAVADDIRTFSIGG